MNVNMMNVNMIVSVLIVLFLATNVYAQEWPSASSIVEKVRTDLNLSQAQYEEVKVIIEENMAKRQQIAQESTLGLSMAQSQVLGTELYTKLSNVLTESQMMEWNKMIDLINQKINATAVTNRKDQPLPVN